MSTITKLEPGVWSNGSQTIVIREIRGDLILYSTGRDPDDLILAHTSWIVDAIQEAGYVLILRAIPIVNPIMVREHPSVPRTPVLTPTFWASFVFGIFGIGFAVGVVAGAIILLLRN
jgi:hypothetical protein